MRTVQALVRADHLRTLSLFELRMLPSHALESASVPLCFGYRAARRGGVRRDDGFDFSLCSNRDPLPGWPSGLSLPQTTSREIGRCLRALCLPLPRRHPLLANPTRA